MIEAVIENPSVYDSDDDILQKEKDILKKLKASCLSEEAYKVWKKDYIDAKVKEISEKKHILACTYMFAGMGQFTEYVLEEELDAFTKWIEQSGSAFLGGVKDANEQQIRAYVKMHIADELYENER